MFYVSMPPFLGFPESPMSEGHYLLINKNLIELIALLVLATTRPGQRYGLDVWLRGLWRSIVPAKKDKPAAAKPAPGPTQATSRNPAPAPTYNPSQRR
jgi:hypothetical protein